MAVFLARMVMPRSRSSSFESITRSATCSLARKVPDWRSMASTSVVLPWSTWAMMAILRIVWLTGREFPLLGFGRAGRGVGRENAINRRTARLVSFYQLWRGVISLRVGLWDRCDILSLELIERRGEGFYDLC